MSKANKSYCRVAFDSVTISPTGRMQLCCESQWPGKPQDEPRVEDIKSIDDWFKGDYMNGVRKAMLAGHRIKECSTCYDKERLHKKSSIYKMIIYEHNLDPIAFKIFDLKI